LLTAKNTLLAAQQQVLQAKYGAVLNLKLLNFYQNIPITL
jgi:outer membrane protein